MKHYIVVKWKRENKNRIDIKEIKTIFNKLLDIKDIKGVELHENIIDRLNRYDLMVEIVMAKECLELYDNSPAHKEWKEKYSNMIESKAIFDSEE